jgi:hypothetical protein
MKRRVGSVASMGVALLAGLAVLAAGCGPAARAPAAAAQPTGDPAFERAKAECTQQAIEATQQTYPQGLASKAAIGIYLDCMKQKGFAVGTPAP